MADQSVIFFKGIVKVRSTSWFYIQIPNKVLGTKKRVYLKGTLNSKPCYILANYSDNDSHEVALSKALQTEFGLKNIKAGEPIYLYITEITETPPPLEIATDIEEALNTDPDVKAAWDKLSRSHKTEYLKWINEAKLQETRAKRIEKLLSKLQSD